MKYINVFKAGMIGVCLIACCTLETNATGPLVFSGTPNEVQVTDTVPKKKRMPTDTSSRAPRQRMPMDTTRQRGDRMPVDRRKNPGQRMPTDTMKSPVTPLR